MKISIFLSLSISLSFGFDCVFFSTICDNNPNNEQITHIFQGKKLKGEGLAMEFEILKSFKGEEVRQIIKVWGGWGNSSGVPLSNFPDGQELIVAASLVSEDWSSGTVKKDDYHIPGCGLFVFGTDDSHWVEQAEECLGDIVPICQFSNFHFFPNPVDDILFINIPVEWHENAERSIELFDLNGKRIFHETDLLSLFHDFRIQIDLSNIPQGVYIMHAVIPEICSKKQIHKIIVH